MVDRRLGLRERQRALRRDQLRDLECRLHQLVGLEDVVHEADPPCFLRVDDPPLEDEVLGDAKAADARQPLCPAPSRKDPEIHLRLAELRVRSRVAKVAGERELAAAAEREPVDRRERDLRRDLEQLPYLVAERAPVLGLLDREAAHVLDVRAGRERLVARTGEDDHAHGVVPSQIGQALAQLAERVDVERVHGLGPVDGDDRDRVALALHPNGYETGTFAWRNSTISEVGAPGVKISATPCPLSSAASSSGIVPPTTTSTSSAPLSFSPSRIFGTSVMCAPDRIEIPTASASSWIAVSTICSGVWWRPV